PPSSSSESSAQPSSSQPPSGSGLVASVLQKVLSRPSFPANIASSSQPTYAPAPLQLGMPSYRQADLESNRGLKGKSRAVSAKTAQTGRNRRVNMKSPEFFISRIIFLPHGTAEPEDSGHMEDSGSTSGPLLAHLFPVIRCSRAPSATDLTRLEALGLAHANFWDYFQFNRDWSFSQVDSYLHSLFPTLFAYLDSQPRTINPGYSSLQASCYRYLPPYHLCVKSHKEVAIASGADFPDGKLIYAKDSELFLVTRHKIPYTVLEQWKPCPVTKLASKAAGKRKAIVLSDTESDDTDFASRVADSDGELDAPLSFTQHPSKRFVRTSHDAGMEATMGTPQPPSPDSPLPAMTVPATPEAESAPRPPNSSSFTIDESIANPWKAHHTFKF
ncbi:hypothetical protein M404DRAFT_1008348, partial [Pisolithus tinctorius Marx 270]